MIGIFAKTLMEATRQTNQPSSPKWDAYRHWRLDEKLPCAPQEKCHD